MVSSEPEIIGYFPKKGNPPWLPFFSSIYLITMRKSYGFTLIELMFVIAIIGILAAVAIPNYTDYMKRAKVSEAFILSTTITKAVTDYYAYHGTFPKNNHAIAFPKPEDLGGQYVKSMQIQEGAINIVFKNQLSEELSGKILTLRPLIVDASTTGMLVLTWICGNAKIPEGFSAIGENQTNLAAKWTSTPCK